jgi:hypothetical protein
LDEPVDERQCRCDPTQAADDVGDDEAVLHVRDTKGPKNHKPRAPKQLRSELNTERPEKRSKGSVRAIEQTSGGPKSQGTEEPNGRHRSKCVISGHGRSALPNVCMDTKNAR